MKHSQKIKYKHAKFDSENHTKKNINNNKKLSKTSHRSECPASVNENLIQNNQKEYYWNSSENKLSVVVFQSHPQTVDILFSTFHHYHWLPKKNSHNLKLTYLITTTTKLIRKWPFHILMIFFFSYTALQ